VVFGDAQSLERAMRAAPLRVDGARLGVRKFGDPEPSQQTEGSANAVGRQERHALAAAGLVVFAGGVPAACGDAEIKSAFECYGQVSRAWSFPANGSGDGVRARCAFVVFSDTSSASRAIASAREGGRLRLRGRALAVERPAGAPDDADRPPRHDYDASPYEPPRPHQHDPNAPPRLATEPGRLGLPLAALSLADVPVDQRPLGG